MSVSCFRKTTYSLNGGSPFLKDQYVETSQHPLQDVARIAGLLAVYFFALVVQTLLERELRQAMKKAGIKSLPLYPEGRPCARPTTHRLIELFQPIQRHELSVDHGEPQIMVTELTPVQRQVIELLGLSPDEYGR
jgi:hypothetical protein